MGPLISPPCCLPAVCCFCVLLTQGMWGKLVWELLPLPILRSPMLFGDLVTDGPSGGVASASILLAVDGARLGSPLLMLELLLLRRLAWDRVRYPFVWMDREEGSIGSSLDH